MNGGPLDLAELLEQLLDVVVGDAKVQVADHEARWCLAALVQIVLPSITGLDLRWLGLDCGGGRTERMSRLGQSMGLSACVSGILCWSATSFSTRSLGSTEGSFWTGRESGALRMTAYGR